MAKKNKKNKYLPIILVVIISFLLPVAFFKLGLLGILINNMIKYLFGDGVYFIFIVNLLYFIYYLITKEKENFNWRFLFALILFNILIILFYSLSFEKNKGFEIFSEYLSFDLKLIFSQNDVSFKGGLLGSIIYSFSNYLLDKTGTIILMISIFLIILVILIPYSYFLSGSNKIKNKTENIINNFQQSKLIKKNKSFKNIILNDKDVILDEKHQINDKEINKINYSKSKPIINSEIKNVDDQIKIRSEISTRKTDDYKLPSLELLDKLSKSNSDVINKNIANIKGQRIVEILNSFDIPCELMASHIGPSVTKFQIKPDRGVKINKILGLANNIKMELAAKSIRIEAPIPGINAVGIEIPNVESTPVQMLELIQNIPNNKQNEPLLIALGKDIMGKNIYCELNKMPHLLIAGATGSGKSVCTNAIISSILLRCHPDDVKLMLIDPKRVEFLPYKDIPHLFWPVIDDSNLAATALKKAVVIMEDRYRLLAENGVRNIESYNDKVISFNKNCKEEEKMNTLAYMVIIIDELADLMIVAGKDVEASIQQITQKARAAGIHLIVATQRPSTDVITGVIKANIPSRIAFSVASQVDSRTILDAKGAEDLLGKGDMLYIPIGSPNALRVQGVYINDNEIKNIVEFVKQQKKVEYEPSFYNLENISEFNNSGGIMAKFEDDLYEEVKNYIISIQKCSASIVQRRFAVGYNRAARLVDMLEENGVVGPAQGSKPREVYYKDDES